MTNNYRKQFQDHKNTITRVIKNIFLNKVRGQMTEKSDSNNGSKYKYRGIAIQDQRKKSGKSKLKHINQ